MKYEKILDSIADGRLNRGKLTNVRRNTEAKLQQGDQDAHATTDAVTPQEPKCLLFSVHYLGVGTGVRG